MKIAFVVQARMCSTRMPEKILRPFFGNKCLLQLLVEKLSKVEDVDLIIATSVREENDVIEAFCEKNRVLCFRGDENDVLKRFIDAADIYGITHIIRVCSDNPFLELDSIRHLVTYAKKTVADYISFKINGTPSIKTHFGFWTEFTTIEALKKVQKMTSDKIYHEHVTNYIYEHPVEFKIEWIEGPKCLDGRSNIRLTIDTPEDFTNAQKVYADICSIHPYPTIDEVVSYLDVHPETFHIMDSQIKLNSK